MIFSLIHPSRERSSQAYNTFLNWMQKASTKNTYQYIVSIDDDDKQALSYEILFKGTGVLLISNDNKTLIDAVNKGALKAKGDVLICVSDDFDCPLNWDIELAKIINPKKLQAIHVDDNYSNHGRLLTIPILTMKLYEDLGYIYHPAFDGMYVDNYLYEVCDKKDVVIKSSLVFDHLHYTNGKAPIDATYRKHNTAEKYKQGRELFDHLMKSL